MSQTQSTTLRGLPRRLQAVQLRLAGLSYEDIGQELGVTRQRAWTLVQKEMRRLGHERAEAAATLQRIELEGLDALHRTYWPAAIAGDLDAAAFVLRLMQRRARLLGLDAPPAKGESAPAVELRITVEQVAEARRRAGAFRAGSDQRNGRGNPDQHG
jgi:hypothetical protein